MSQKVTKFVCSLQLVFLLFVSSVLAQDNAPVVTNVDLQQRTDGTMLVDIYYDVYDADGNLMAISIKASSDSGATWNLSCNNLTGAIGVGISSGTGKHIVWDVSVEHPNFFSNTVIVEITADDGGPTCPGIPTVTYGGKVYNTVQIGSQCWLKENLDIGTMIQANQEQGNNGIIEKYCYDNNQANCATYGGLYQWNEAMQYSTTPGIPGICPTGWHIPTLTEFQTLTTIVNNDGNALKSVGQGTQSGQGTNTSGFSAMLAGYCYWNCRDLGNGNFWSSSDYSGNPANLFLYGYISNIFLSGFDAKGGHSIRCIKDN